MHTQTVNITNARENLYTLAKDTLESHEPITITTKEGDVVMLSKEDYEPLQETLYIMTNKGLAKEALHLKDASDAEFGTKDDLPW